MKKGTRILQVTLLLLGLLIAPTSSMAFDQGNASRIIKDIEEMMRGTASIGEMEMTVHNPKWERTMKMKFWESVPDKMLVRVTAPAQDVGVGTLKLGDDLWSYNPHIDQIQKIPPSLMLDSWMGSDFTNDDITRESSITDDYTVENLEEGAIGKEKTWRITSRPKPSSPVGWDLLVIEATQDGHRPLRQEYYNEKKELVRVMIYSDYKLANNGKLYPFKWRMESKREENRFTEVKVLSMEFKDKLSKRIFSIRSLKKGRR